MSMGRRKRERQNDLWVPTAALQSRGHPFYAAVNRILAGNGFDAFAERECERFYTQGNGRPGMPPGVYFRMLLVGYFEGIGSERGIDWRCADSLALREFLGYGPGDATPDHSTISRTRRLIDVETHTKVFDWMLKLIADEGLVSGKTLGADSTTLEANAAMRSIVRRDTGQGYAEFLTELAKASGTDTPTREDIARIDRTRKKKASNADWEHPHDPDARIARMKDGTTHLAHKLEQVVDMETGAIVAAEIHEADRGDTATVTETLVVAAMRLDRMREDPATASRMHACVASEIVLDKGYHSGDVLTQLEDMGMRSYVSQPRLAKGKRRRWAGKGAERRATYANQRRIRGERGRQLLRKRGELLERPFAHELETGGLRRTHVWKHKEVRKRIALQAAAANLGLLMRTKFGIGAPRLLQDRPTKAMAALAEFAGKVAEAVAGLSRLLWELLTPRPRRRSALQPRRRPSSPAAWLARAGRT